VPCSSSQRPSRSRTLRFATNWWSFGDPSADPGSPVGTGSSQSGSPASGQTRGPVSSSSSRPRSSPGIAEGSNSTRVELHGQPGRPPGPRPRDSPSDPAYGPRESHLRAPAHPSGPHPARLRGRRADHRQVHAPDLAHASEDRSDQPKEASDRDRLRLPGAADFSGTTTATAQRSNARNSPLSSTATL